MTARSGASFNVWVADRLASDMGVRTFFSVNAAITAGNGGKFAVSNFRLWVKFTGNFVANPY
jgi:hypothetical protein